MNIEPGAPGTLRADIRKSVLSSEALAQDVEAQEGFYDLSKRLSPQRSSTTEIFDALHSNGAGVL